MVLVCFSLFGHDRAPVVSWMFAQGDVRAPVRHTVLAGIQQASPVGTNPLGRDACASSRRSLVLLGLTLLTTVNAAAMVLQDPAIKVNVHTDETNTTWYTSPAALAIGALVVLLIIVLAVMAGRRKSSTTTVIR